ncbi:hypothetical protein DY000_02005404 [Brassica cretica]|uniref:Uncharacterized protein n=1 Tax=Brassica cretica TaxID=69181 RepID=A0ABQ7CEQ1_BRACR|nr:hypothetical protein DY000_02005404 [Brassica cretica]
MISLREKILRWKSRNASPPRSSRDFRQRAHVLHQLRKVARLLLFINSSPPSYIFTGFFSQPKPANLIAKMTNDNNTPIDTTNVIQTPLNAAATDTTGMTTAANNTA